ncbi:MULTISPECIES: YcaO-like family protein [Brevibacillus]|uniref:YcaO-like family protein n=1 Tax=Brevibacillus TaxID=55080 RepID=UPI002E1B0CC9|nr:YcaO-like family protein [Brevibacillus borstelensis]
MMFEVSKRNFGYKESIFINKTIYLSTSRIGTFKSEDGGLGPVDCGSISRDKKKSIMKGFSESLERRALVIGANGADEDDMIRSFDLISGSVSYISKYYTRLNNKAPFISDTSGTATYTNSNVAMLNAIKELLEKNSTFLFWYGKQGRKLDLTRYSSIYFDLFRKEGYQVRAYVEETFSPLKVAFIIVINPNHITPFKFMAGVGSSVVLTTAIHKAMSEAYLLKEVYDDAFFRFQTEELDSNSYSGIVLNSQMNPECLEYIEILDGLDTYEEQRKDNEFSTLDAEGEIDLIVQNLPFWVKELHTVVLNQIVNRNLIVIKAISPNLYNHAALKKYINIDSDVNRFTVNLDQESLKSIPMCPIL